MQLRSWVWSGTGSHRVVAIRTAGAHSLRRAPQHRVLGSQPAGVMTGTGHEIRISGESVSNAALKLHGVEVPRAMRPRQTATCRPCRRIRNPLLRVSPLEKVGPLGLLPSHDGGRRGGLRPTNLIQRSRTCEGLARPAWRYRFCGRSFRSAAFPGFCSSCGRRGLFGSQLLLALLGLRQQLTENTRRCTEAA